MSDDGDPATERTSDDAAAGAEGESSTPDKEGASETRAAGEPEMEASADPNAGETGPARDDDLSARVLARSELVERVAAADEELATDVEALYGAASDLVDRVAELEADLEAAEAENEDLEERLKRKQADFENYKKRRKREEERIRERATEDLVERLLDVRDDLRRAVEGNYDDVEGIREGVKMTLSAFDRVLDAEDVRQLDPEPGSEVDPQRHEVMTRVESDRPAGTVADVYEPGYEMADTVLRAAKVTVSEGPADGESEAAAEEESTPETGAEDGAGETGNPDGPRRDEDGADGT